MKKRLFTFYFCVLVSIIYCQTNQVNKEADELPLTIFDEAPLFPGGIEKMLKYIESSVHYPKVSNSEKIARVCLVSLVVEKDGSVTNAKIKRGIDGLIAFDREAIRVVSAMPKWQPGKSKGKIVRTQINIPVRFAQKE